MPPRSARSTASAAPARQQTRSRTGCLTCRQRKLKCDEVRPMCGQCRKSNRECVPSEGITFRHQQNASLNADSKELEKFYERNTFTAGEYFLPVSNTLTWALANTGTEDSASPPPESSPSGTNAAQQVAAHSLEALSTAADISYTPQQPQHAAYYTTNAPSASHPEYGFVQPENVGNGMGQPGNNIPFILNPSSGQTHSSVIDPSLETAIARAID
ncbi:uncharacterized protein A1O9_01837, partial [Exophiala aquamarina CBS 119918]